jgi:hypothetical protein
MRILAIGQSYFNTTPFGPVFRQAGYEFLSIGWNQHEQYDVIIQEPLIRWDDLLTLLPSSFTPDIIIYFDHSEPIRIIGLEEATIPTIFYSVDIHIHTRWHPQWSGCFDLCLLAMKEYMALFEGGKYTPPTFWFPLWSNQMGPAPTTKRDVDASFRGSLGLTHPKRKIFLTGVRKKINLDFGGGPFFDLYNNSKIILNDCINDDLNWRVFEAMSSGALLLTPLVSLETLELFPANECLITYRAHDVDDAVDKIQFYLSHQHERLRIAQNGYDAVKRKHTATHRAEALLNHILNIKQRSQNAKRFSAIISYINMAKYLRFDEPQFMHRFICAAWDAIDKLITRSELFNISAVNELLQQCITIREFFSEIYSPCVEQLNDTIASLEQLQALLTPGGGNTHGLAPSHIPTVLS